MTHKKEFTDIPSQLLEFLGIDVHHLRERIRSGRRGRSQYSGYFSAGTEVRALFKDWIAHIGEEIEEFSAKTGRTDVESIAREFKISQTSAQYFLQRMAEDRTAGDSREA